VVVEVESLTEEAVAACGVVTVSAKTVALKQQIPRKSMVEKKMFCFMVSKV
jgi:hypothetical protein